MNKFKKYFEKIKYNDKCKILIECTEAAADELLPLLKELKIMGNIGASRSIKIEDWENNDNERKGTFGFDGDGPSTIFKIQKELSNK